MASVSQLPDRSLGVFTSVAVRQGEPVLLERHLLRLERSCQELYQQSLPLSVESQVLALTKTMSDTDRLRIEAVPSGSELVVRMKAAPRPGGSEPIELDIIVAPWWNCGHKWIDRSNLPSSRTLFVDDHGYVLETDISNVFAVFDGEVVTPPLDGRVLPGIGRSLLLDIRPVREAPLALEQFLQADEAFATNALRGVVPIARCGATVWPSVGATTAELMTTWEANVR